MTAHINTAEHSAAARICFITRKLLSCRARTRIPPGRVTLFLEMRARPEGRDEIRRIDDFSGDDQQRFTTRQIESIEVLGHDGVSTVRYAVLAEIPGLHVRRHHFQ